MNILTQNVCGLSDGKLQTISNNISPSHDILILNETHLKHNQRESVIKKLGYQNHRNRFYSDSSPNPQDYKGVILIIAKRTPFIPHTVLTSGTGNHIIAVGSYQNKHIIIGGFYGHSAGSDITSRQVLKSFLDKFHDQAKTLSDPTMIILGDFNFILDPTDHSNPNHRRKPLTEMLFKTFTRSHNLTDTHLDIFDSSPPPHTFKRGNTSARLDRIYITRHHQINTILKQGHLVPSDHTSLLYNWNWTKTPRTLRFPDYLLKSKKFLTKLHNSTRELLITNCDKQDLIEDYHSTPPGIPVPDHLRFTTEEIKSSLPNEFLPPKPPHTKFIDRSSKYQAAKLKQFAHKFSPTSDIQDSIISLTKLARITANHISNLELVLTTLLSQAVSDGMNYSRNITKNKTAELECIKAKILRYTTENLPHNHTYVKLTTKRDQIQETLNFRHKFQKIAKHNAQNSRSTSYFLADSEHSSKPKITKLIDTDGNPHSDENATL